MGCDLLLNGFLFNRIPLLKKIEMAQVLSFRGIYGNLSDKNNPNSVKDCLPFRQEALLWDTSVRGSGVGVENILKVLRVDYVWRLTYRDLP